MSVTNIDPTRTITLRRTYERDMARRMRALSAAVWGLVVVGDAFGLTPLPTLQLNAGQWRFESRADKQKAFREWLAEQTRKGILATDARNPARPWTGAYVAPAYDRGTQRAYTDAKPGEAAGDPGAAAIRRRVFTEGVDMRKVELLYTRSFENLADITKEMSDKMGAVLAHGLAAGHSPETIAAELVRQVDGITNKRALVMARTEIIYAHAEGQLDALERMGVGEVGVAVEWVTSGAPCIRCAEAAGRNYTVAEAHGLIPLHPNCRCAWKPVLIEQPKRRRRR